MAKGQFKRFRHPDFLAISQCKVCVFPQARPARYNLSMVCLRSCYMLDTDVIVEMVSISAVEEFQLTLILCATHYYTNKQDTSYSNEFLYKQGQGPQR